MWAAADGTGLEQLRLRVDRAGFVVESVVLGVAEDGPFQLRYHMRGDAGWRLREVRIAPVHGVEPALHLASDGAGRWFDAAGAALPELDGCLDADLTATPFTNTLPIRRLRLAPGEAATLRMVYIVAPELRVMLERQRYTCLEQTAAGGRYRYESLDTGFTAELPVDADGLITDYPALFTRVWPRREAG